MTVRSEKIAEDDYHEERATLISPVLTDWTSIALQSIPDAVCAKDIHGRIMTANTAMVSSYGLTSADGLIGKTIFDLVPIEAAREVSEADERVIRSGKPEFDVEQRMVDADGQTRWIQTSRAPLFDGNVGVIGVVSVSRDVGARKDSERLMLAQANLLDMVAQSIPIREILAKIISVIEEHLPGMTATIRLLSANGLFFQETVAPSLANEFPGFIEDDNLCFDLSAPCTTTGLLESAIVSNILADPSWPGDRDSPAKAGIRGFWSSPVLSYDRRVLGVFNLYSSTVGLLTDTQMDLVAMVGHMVSAAIDRKEAEERTKFLAAHDALTGLPNRTMFEERLATALDVAREQQLCLALAFFDLDKFKLINDSLGHGAGDELLKIVAARALQGLRQNDLVARLGGDEFVMLLMAPQGSGGIEVRLSEIRRAISAPVSLGSRTLQVTCSMGVACFPDHAHTSMDLLAHADAAMYRAKTFGRDNVQFFNAGMAVFAEERLALNAELRNAVARHEFVLHYQPLVDVKTGRIFGSEALVRWNHPERGLLHPGDFIDSAEDTGLIVPLGEWILYEACRQNKLWQIEGHRPVVVSVNVSARQFREPDWVERVAITLRRSGLDASFLQLELTETLIIQDMAMAVDKMHELEGLGIQLAIDDFGIGYSSLSVLKSLPVHCLKIDQSFVKDIPHDDTDKAITAAIIVMAQALNLRTIAEGVETAEQLAFLRQHNCHDAQGFFYSRPVCADAFEGLLAKDGWVHAVEGACEIEQRIHYLAVS